MSDNEQQVYEQVSKKIKEVYLDAAITNQKLSKDQTIFPAVSIVLTDNAVLSQYSTFEKLENVCNETFEFEVANTHESGINDVKGILMIIDREMSKFGYLRNQLSLMEDKNYSFIVRLAKYEKLITK